MPHAENQIFMPALDYVEDAGLLRLLRDRIAVLPGRVAVLMEPAFETFMGSSLLAPQGSHAGKYRPDSGVVITSGTADLGVGDRVIVKPYDGLWLTDKDASWVPKGREVRLYGVSAPWHESIVAKLGR